MTRKSMGILAAIGALTVVGVGAFTMWYSAEAIPPDGIVIGEMSANSGGVPTPIPPPDAPLETSTEPGDSETPISGRLMVEIQGAVAAPGVYSFSKEARVHDALEKAGGPLGNAEIRDINIAAALIDGSVLSVPYQRQEGGSVQAGAADLNPPAYTRSGWTDTTLANPAPTSGAPAAPVSVKVNINTATQAELETLPGVGEKTAEKIMRHRESQPFTQVDELGFVQGIGEKRLETLRPHVTVE